MTRYEIKELAIEAGFTLRDQPDGTRDLNPYVYAFAGKVVALTISELNQESLSHGSAMFEDEA